MTATTATSISSRAIIVLGAILACSSSVTAFAPAPAHRQFGSSSSSRAVRDARQAHRNPIVRSSSYTLGDGMGSSGARTSSSSTQSSRNSPSSVSSAAGWVRAKVSQAGGVRRGSPSQPQPQQKGDWSKLFAAPGAEMAQGGQLVGGLSRSCAGLAEGSCGSSVIFFGMVSLVYTFAPVFAAQSLFAWGLGRAAYWWSMRGADVSQRLPAGFVGYMSLFLMVGGLSFMNGLKGIALIA